MNYILLSKELNLMAGTTLCPQACDLVTSLLPKLDCPLVSARSNQNIYSCVLADESTLMQSMLKIMRPSEKLRDYCTLTYEKVSYHLNYDCAHVAGHLDRSK